MGFENEKDQEKIKDVNHLLLAFNEADKNKGPEARVPADRREQQNFIFSNTTNEKQAIEEQRILNQAIRARDPLYTPKSTNFENTNNAIEKLADNASKEREKACDSLEKMGERALPALYDAQKSRDAAVNSAAKRLIDRIEIRSILVPSTSLMDQYDKLDKRQALPDKIATYQEMIKTIDKVDQDRLLKVIARIEKNSAWEDTLALDDLQTIALIIPYTYFDYADLLIENNKSAEAITHLASAIKKNPAIANNERIWMQSKETKALQDKNFFETYKNANGDLLAAGFKFKTAPEEEEYLRTRLSLLQQHKIKTNGRQAVDWVDWTQTRLFDNLVKQEKPEAAQLILEQQKNMPSVQAPRLFAITDLYINQGKTDKANKICLKLQSLRNDYIDEHQEVLDRHGDNVLRYAPTEFDKDLRLRIDKVTNMK